MTPTERRRCLELLSELAQRLSREDETSSGREKLHIEGFLAAAEAEMERLRPDLPFEIEFGRLVLAWLRERLGS
jgi:hypothetical protein